MKYVTIGGVPEHFNLPWHLVIEELNSGNASVRLDWQDCLGGTGEMCAALRDETLDMAIVLTEGILKDIQEGNKSEVVEVFISSPLIWGVHVAAKSQYTSIDELKDTTAAISRPGSGSDLMTKVLADNHNWPKDDIKTEVVGNLEGGRKALREGSADYFLWEKYTTKPYVDNGEFRRLGECPTPWPCFVIATSKRFMAENPEVVTAVIELVREKTEWVKEAPEAIAVIAEQYNLNPADVADWRMQTQWMQTRWSEDLEQKILVEMRKFGIVS